MTAPNTQYVLSEEMQSLVYRSSVYSPADSDLDSCRAAYDAMCRHYTLPQDGKIDIEDHHLENADHNVGVRLYRPKAVPAPVKGWPCVLYFHGGGFVVGGLDSHEFLLSYICQDLNIAVLSVDYRLAPEHHFPAAHDDCKFAYTWLKRMQLNGILMPLISLLPVIVRWEFSCGSRGGFTAYRSAGKRLGDDLSHVDHPF